MAQENNNDEAKRRPSHTGFAHKGRKTIKYLQKCKDNGVKLVQMCTAGRDEMWIMAADIAGCDICRVCGEMFMYQLPLEMHPQMHAAYIKSARSMAPNIHFNFYMDTPMFVTKRDALYNSVMLIQAGADSMEPMGASNEMVKYLTDNMVPVFGHIGCISGWQTAATGYVKMGKTAEDAMKVFKMGYEYQENGMKCMTIELTPQEVSEKIAKKLRVPVISIAGSAACDGSEMVDMDTFGITANPPSHTKQYANYMEFAVGAYAAWANDVRTGAYPEDKHCWHMDPKEAEKFNEMIDKF